MKEESLGADQTDVASDLYVNSNQGCVLLSSQVEDRGTHPEERPYKCNLCDKSYRHAGSLVNHKKTHQVGLYACLVCQKEFSNPMGLKSHLRTHSEEKRFKCEQCGEAFRMSQQLYNHRRSSHGFSSVAGAESLARDHKVDEQAPILIDNSNLISNLENYIAESMVPGDFSQIVSKYYQDGSPPVEEPRKDDVVTQHEFMEETREEQSSNDNNTEEYRYKCNQCEKAYKHAGSLANHRQSHMVGLYQCTVCFKEFSNLMAMKNHCRLHSDSRARQRCKSPRYSAKMSSPLLGNTDTLQSNILHSSYTIDKCADLPAASQASESGSYEEDTEKLPSPVPKVQEDPHPDSFCSQRVLQSTSKDSMEHVEENMLDHSSTFLPEEETGQQSEQQQCDETLEGKSEDSENRPFRCQDCGKTYRHAGSLINHKKTHQTGVYSCSLCSKQMFNVAALNNHFRAHFKSRAGRKVEDNYFHSANFSDLFQNPEDPFQCRICGEYLPNESDFLQHQVIHQEEAIKETFSDTQNMEEPLESGTCWAENPHVTRSNSDTSGPSIPNPVKLEMEDFAQHQTPNPWTREQTLTTPPEETPQNNSVQFQDASSGFEQLTLDETVFKEESSEIEGHDKASVDRPYKCEPCGRTYRHKSSLINHKLTHKTGIYQCSLCPKQYSNLMALRNHLRFHSRSYAGRRGILSRRGRQYMRGRPRFMQNKTAHSLAESEKLDETISSQTDVIDTAVTETLTRISCSCGESFDGTESFQCHSQMCQNSLHFSATEPPVDLKKEETPLADPQNAFITAEKAQQESPIKVLEASEHQGRRVYECDLCNKSYRHSGSLINHKRTHQTGDYMCPYCSRHVHNMAALKNHIRIHHKIKKNQHGKMQDDPRFLYSDLCYPPQGAKNLFGCVSCEEIFHSEDDLVAHQMVHMALEGDSWEQKVQESNSDKSLSLEDVGDSEWERSNNSNIHGVENHGSSELISEGYSNHIDYTCIECGEVYTSIGDLNDHKLTHQIGIYQCSFCPKEYPNLQALRDHFQSHTKPHSLRNAGKENSDGTESNQIVEDPQTFDSRYDCGHCGLIFSNEVDFHQHQVAHEKQAMAESIPVLDTEGKAAEFAFPMDSSERELLRRIKSELEEVDDSNAPDGGGSQLSHICGYCGQTYDDLESLQTHSLNHSAEEKCLTSENMNSDAENKYNNLQQTPGVKEEENSDETAKTEESQENRPYTCDQCGKSYRHGGSLVNHKKTHLVGNFQCVACSKQYPNMAAYINHLRHHPECKNRVAVNSQHEPNASHLHDSPYSTGEGTFLSLPSGPSPNPSASHVLPSDFKPCIDTLAIENSCLDHSSIQRNVQIPANRAKLPRKRRSRPGEKRSYPNTSPPLEGGSTSVTGVSDVDDKLFQSHDFSGTNFYGVKESSLNITGNCDKRCKTELVRHAEETIKDEIPSLACSSRNQYEVEGVFHQRPFRCEVCNRSYRHAGSLINHKQTHKTGVFRCSICQKRFFNLMAMKNHNRIHFELKRHKCLDCGKAFRLRKQLDTHQRLHWQRSAVRKSGRRNRRNTRCRKFAQTQQRKATSFCAKAALDPADASGNKTSDSSVKREPDPDSRPFRCEECGRSYRHAGSLFNHKKSHKTGQYFCSICNKTYSNLMAMKNHERNHYETKRHHCLQCGKTFKWKRQLTRHQFVHAQEKSQSGSQLPVGGQKSSTGDDYQTGRSTGFCKRSRESSSPISTNSKKRHRGNSAPSTKEPVCKACGVTFASGDELKSHSCSESCIKFQNSAHDDLAKPTLSKEDGERPYGCDVCGRTYRHAGSLLNHKNTHKNGLYKCSLCNKQFFNPMAIKNHLRTHTAKKKFQCMECGKAFRSSRQLICHIRVHTGIGPFRCLTCNREFSSKLALKRHQRAHKKSNALRSSTPAVPSNEETSIYEKSTSDPFKVEPNPVSLPAQERKYKCNQCDRSYRHAGSLFNHKKTHRTGVYKCPDCLKEFFNLLAYKNHLRVHKYPCKDCGKAFRIAGHLAAHRKIHEQEGPFACSLCDKWFFSQSSYELHQETHDGPASDVREPQLLANLMVEVT